MGLQMGANALTERYIPGFFRAQISAPCPPMLDSKTQGGVCCFHFSTFRIIIGISLPSLNTDSTFGAEDKQ